MRNRPTQTNTITGVKNCMGVGAMISALAFKWIAGVICLVLTMVILNGCAVLAGAAAGGATGYVAGHHAGKEEAQEEIHEHSHDDHDDKEQDE